MKKLNTYNLSRKVVKDDEEDELIAEQTGCAIVTKADMDKQHKKSR